MLVTDTIRARWVSTLAWGLGTGLFSLFIGLGYGRQAADFPGGPAAFGASLEVAARSMRLLRWPAEHLDTFGGYLTYHNVLLFTVFLGLWAALQGIKVTRGPVAERQLELLLATGVSRAALVRARALGFAATMALICVGLALGTFAGSVAAGSPDLAGSVLTVVGVWGAALACYGLGLLAAQWVPSQGAATAVVFVALATLYVLDNAADLLGAAGALRLLSPFSWANAWRALLPGRPVSLPALGVLAGMALLAWGLGAWAFSRRDLFGALVRWRPRGRAADVGRVRFHGYWWTELWRTRWRLVAWSLATAFFAALMLWLEPAVTDALQEMEMMRRMFTVAGRTLEEQYLSFSLDVVLPLEGAFAAAHVAAWVSEREDGRLELMRAQPIGWTRLWLERGVVLGVGATVVCALGLAGITLGARTVGLSLDGGGALRAGLVGILLALSVGGLGAVAAVTLRGALPVVLVSSLLGLSYFIVYLVPMFDWPDWVSRLSLFGASGHPYIEAPAPGGLLLLVALALGGPLLAAALSRRAPAV